ncbi:MAG: Gfo/Idh/MocA family oxidoreductase [Calditrichaeota bacterium]|nr:Gfo/Idh/MocA family oxidoreductase [Calditrichota bacterium]
MSGPIKLGIIGCGIAARDLHYPALQKLKDKFEITVVCNHTEPKARDFAELVGNIPYVLDYHELLQRDDVEAVDIILPIDLNFQATKDALEAGKHVMLEKPIAANLDEADEMLAFPEKYPLVMMVAENFRYRPTFRRVKDLLSAKVIGEVYSVFWNVFYHVDRSNKYAMTEWRINHKYPGGFITDGGVHNIAALRFLFGDFEGGHAFVKSINREIGEQDTFSLQFRTKSGVDGVFSDFFSANGYSENRMIIFASEGSIIVSDNSISILRQGKKTQLETVDDDGGYYDEFVDFYHAVRNGQRVIATFQESHRDLEIIIQALEAAERKVRVRF